jgi:conjugative transposon TraN protein
MKQTKWKASGRPKPGILAVERAFGLMFIFFYTCPAFCQTTIPSYPLEITINKTTNLIFPYSIKSVDRGSSDLAARIATGTENVLQLKAEKQNFAPTNLSVITSDGKLYPFSVRYSPEPSKLNLSFGRDSLVQLSREAVNVASMDSSIARVLKQPRFMRVHAKSEGMALSLSGVYIHDHILWFSFELNNHSLIDYSPDFIKLFIQDRNQAKRTAEQQTQVAVLNNLPFRVLSGRGKKDFVLAFKQFTIPKDKLLLFQMSEENGGRLLELKIKHKALLRARVPSE